ncbi:MAG: ferritin [Spirochaetia bacterium]|nr:ferritin [Spirochaetota bacterium]MCX8096457.1 ferritin [Spirochaetota bacterium]MDW8112739.1 ferritin [Spirochaetia bacterium]
MLKREMEDALNRQINEELYSSYLYLSMSAYFEQQGLSGFSKWMMIQAKEELKHAMKIYNYIISQNGVVKLFGLKEPPHTWDSILHAAESAYEHEKYITNKIHELVNLAQKIDDKATENFLQWFVEEQVEEEKNSYDLLRKVRMVEKHVGALLQLDRILSEREDEED